MHNKSQHHSRTHNMVDSVKTDKEREKLADGKHTKINLKQLSTKLLGTHYWTSLLVRGECNWPSIKTDFIFPHHTHSNRMLITLLLSSSRAGPMVDSLFVNSSEAGPILGALTEGLQEQDRSWELLFRAWWQLHQISEHLLGALKTQLIPRTFTLVGRNLRTFPDS